MNWNGQPLRAEHTPGHAIHRFIRPFPLHAPRFEARRVLKHCHKLIPPRVFSRIVRFRWMETCMKLDEYGPHTVDSIVYTLKYGL